MINDDLSQKKFQYLIFSNLFKIFHFSFQSLGFVQAKLFDNVQNEDGDFLEWQKTYQSYDGYSVCLI